MELPKPTKAERRVAEEAQKKALAQYRFIQSSFAILRDDNLCVFCWFLKGKRTRRADIHHIYGRGKEAGDWREHFTCLLSTCRECHPLPIQTPGGNADLAYVEEVRKKANETPINKRFAPVSLIAVGAEQRL